MRGKRGVNDGAGVGGGNIPAYAGKTAAWVAFVADAREHPRVCGENSYFYSTSCPHQGTSPRMRGKPREEVLQLIEEGNIPAYAGKTTIWIFPTYC